MKTSAKYLLLTVLIFLVGCASAPQQHWSHQTKTGQQFYQDNSQCSSMANSGGNMYQNVPNTGQPFDTSGLQNTLGQIGDQNRRTNIKNQCMYGKGWYLTTENVAANNASKKPLGIRVKPVKKVVSTTSMDSAITLYKNREYQAALVEFKVLAEQGHAFAKYGLGIMYAYGEGVVEDDREAVTWFKQAAEQGLAVAQFNLGLMYANGEGVPEDMVQAYAWSNLAAAQGEENAISNKSKIAKKMTPSQIEKAQELSKNIFQKIPH